MKRQTQENLLKSKIRKIKQRAKDESLSLIKSLERLNQKKNSLILEQRKTLATIGKLILYKDVYKYSSDLTIVSIKNLLWFITLIHGTTPEFHFIRGKKERVSEQTAKRRN